MKIQQFALREPSSALYCKRPRPLVPKLSISTSGQNAAEKGEKRPPPPTTIVEVHSGGTRWNPTREQIGILEMLYRGGMRTPNAHQIESITAQLSRYGRIEGKNVFYWFQNHKARERQRQKRCNVGLRLSTGFPERDSRRPDSGRKSRGSLKGNSFADGGGGGTGQKKEEEQKHEDSSYNKRKWRSWGDQILEIESRSSSEQRQDETLELFPLHPEAR